MRRLFLFVAVFSLFSTTMLDAQVKGKASFYSDWFHGRMTANGEYYNKNAMTCAHLTLPFGTKLKVRNLRNNKVVYVVVNDRGPYIKGRMIDLSRAAAKKIGMIKRGVASVEITKVREIPERVVIDNVKTIVIETPKTIHLPLNKVEFEIDKIPFKIDNTLVVQEHKIDLNRDREIDGKLLLAYFGKKVKRIKSYS